MILVAHFRFVLLHQFLKIQMTLYQANNVEKVEWIDQNECSQDDNKRKSLMTDDTFVLQGPHCWLRMSSTLKNK